VRKHLENIYGRLHVVEPDGSRHPVPFATVQQPLNPSFDAELVA